MTTQDDTIYKASTASHGKVMDIATHGGQMPNQGEDVLRCSQ